MTALQDPARLHKCDDEAFQTNGQDDLHTSTQSSLLDNEPISEGEWHLSEGDTCAPRLSQLEPPFNGGDVSLNAGAPDSFPRSFFATHQYAPWWNSPLSPFPELDNQLGIVSLQSAPRSPSADPTPRIDTFTDLLFKTPPTPYQPPISYDPTAEQEYQVPRCAQDYEAVHVIIAAIEEPILDTRTATFPIGEMLVDPATARETLGEYIVSGNGITSSSAHYYSSTSVYLNENASPFAAGRAGRHPMASSIRVARAGRNRTRFSCHVCNVGFVQKQGLNRHNRDKHQPRNICPHCGVFRWSPARHYLLTKHFETDHPGVPL
ncbi:hypothetical protein EDB83DRAFT_1839722 [Lactarius deliciosus]|nr:hypothetical protein EDB83DRAFT_1839722 [Lactarius deliciosus]